MDNRVYYGEYSLTHWIGLMLKGNISLPDYQRHFVWSEDDVKTLIDTFKEKLFVPPITIGAYKDQHQSRNLILDGQQRLTSILLAYLGRFPNQKSFQETSVVKFADESGEDVDDVIEEPDTILKWTFKELVKFGRNKEDILIAVSDSNYKILSLQVAEKFFDETFLGFSYLVPYISDKKQQQKYYSSVFRHINIQGKTLLPQESRQSLYYLNDELFQFFDPKFFQPFTVGLTIKSRADFVRYMALLSQYRKNENSNVVARGYKSYMESYYEEYIFSVVDDTDSDLFGKFSTLFPDKKYEERFSHLEISIHLMSLPKNFPSIIDLDMWFFGLIYMIVFQNGRIDETKKDELKQEIEKKIEEFRDDSPHARAPSALKYLRSRIDTSISIFKKYENE
jgi:hypothetical protein